MVTRPRALAYLTSSSRQIASAQHFASEALWPRAQGYGGLQSAVKAQLPLRNGSLTQDKQRGRRFGKECLRESRSTHLQKLLSQKWGGGRQKAWHHPQVRSSLPCLRTGPAAGRRPGQEPESRRHPRLALTHSLGRKRCLRILWGWAAVGPLGSGCWSWSLGEHLGGS